VNGRLDPTVELGIDCGMTCPISCVASYLNLQVSFLLQNVELGDMSSDLRVSLAKTLAEQYDVTDAQHDPDYKLITILYSKTPDNSVVLELYVVYFSDSDATAHTGTATNIVNQSTLTSTLDYFLRKSTNVLIESPTFLKRMVIQTTAAVKTSPTTSTTTVLPPNAPSGDTDSSIKIGIIAITGGAAGGFIVFVIVSIFRFTNRRGYKSSVDTMSPVTLGLPIQDEPVDIWIENHGEAGAKKKS
jgi:hypothetical protein